MITDGSMSIDHIADCLRTNTSTLSDSSAVLDDIRLAAMLTRLVGEDYDRAADVLVADRTEVAALLSDALALVSGDGALTSAVRQRLSDNERSFRVTDLAERAHLDNTVICQLYAASTASTASSVASRTLEARIWAYLDNYAQRRRYRTAP